jgi:hypothetical protein
LTVFFIGEEGLIPSMEQADAKISLRSKEKAQAETGRKFAGDTRRL